MSSPKLRWSKPNKSPPERPSKLSLNSFFGLKSKKPLSHDPPSASDPDVASLCTGRAPSKSMSSTRSCVDSFGPKTPTDGLGESRRSLLTLSDHDPFAGRGIAVVSSPQSAAGSNRFSIHSNSSLPEVIGGKLEGRALFSSPTLSPAKDRSFSPDSGLFTSHPAFAQPDITRARKSVLKVSSADLTRKRAPVTSDALLSSASEEIPVKSDFSSILTGHPPRPMRARGLTESAMINRSGSLLNSRGLTQTSDGGLVREVSVSRLGSPLSAPPSHELPPPPISSDVSGSEDNAVPAESTSSTLSFSSVSSDACLPKSPRKKGKLLELSPTVPQKSSATVPIRKPKKAASHSSLAKLSISISSMESLRPRAEGEQASPRKQSSFHPPKLPALPNINYPSASPMPSNPSGSQSSVTEQRRSSATSLTCRRRLFSATRRPSTSRSISVDDDAQSVFSWRSEQNPPLSPSRPWVRSSSCSPSFGDDGTGDEPNSPQLASKYTPQHIMSPAEMAEVAASVASPRSRGLSISTITSFKEQDNELFAPATSPPLSPFGNSGKSNTFPSRSSSLLFKNSAPPHQWIPTHSSTPQANRILTANEQSTYQPSSSPPLSLVSLPPPPRPRQRTTTGPIAPPSSKALTDPGFQTVLQPVPRKNLLPKSSVGEFLRRHSLLRKPSFLEIDDDVQDAYKPAKSPDDSFLDLTRESFDTLL